MYDVCGKSGDNCAAKLVRFFTERPCSRATLYKVFVSQGRRPRVGRVPPTRVAVGSPKASTNVLHNPGCPQGRAPESSPRHIVDPHALVSEGRRFIVQLRCTKLVVLLRSTTNCGFQNKHKGAKHSEARTTTQPTSLSKSDPSPHYIVF